MKKSIILCMLISLMFSSCYFYDELKALVIFGEVEEVIEEGIKTDASAYLGDKVDSSLVEASVALFSLSDTLLFDDIYDKYSEFGGDIYTVEYLETAPLKTGKRTYLGNLLLHYYVENEKNVVRAYMAFDVLTNVETEISYIHGMKASVFAYEKSGFIIDGTAFTESGAEAADKDVANYVEVSNLEGYYMNFSRE